jgi:hypothetical protein
MSLSLPAIPPIMIPGGPILLSPTVSEMHERSTLERYEPRLSAAQTLFGSSIAGSRIRIHRIAAPDGRIDWILERTYDGWQLFIILWRSGWSYPKPIDYCACALLDQALSASPDRILIAKQLRRASRKLVFISPGDDWSSYDWADAE